MALAMGQWVKRTVQPAEGKGRFTGRMGAFGTVSRVHDDGDVTVTLACGCMAHGRLHKTWGEAECLPLTPTQVRQNKRRHAKSCRKRT